MPIAFSQQRVNYNTIAHLYDEPFRDHDVDSNLVLYLSEHSYLNPVNLYILDMGCGTGKQLLANRKHFPTTSMIGLDIFEGMLRQARKRNENIAWVQGDSATPPFQAASFHYITNQFSYHHIQHKERMFPEIYRLLRPGGRFVMTNIDPWSMTGWITYKYFPAAQARDHRDFLPVKKFVKLMESVGFTNIRVNRDDINVEEDLRQFLEYASRRFRASQFMAISDADYSEGIKKIRNEINETNEEKILIKSEFCIVMVTGDKPMCLKQLPQLDKAELDEYTSRLTIDDLG